MPLYRVFSTVHLTSIQTNINIPPTLMLLQSELSVFLLKMLLNRVFCNHLIYNFFKQGVRNNEKENGYRCLYDDFGLLVRGCCCGGYGTLRAA